MPSFGQLTEFTGNFSARWENPQNWTNGIPTLSLDFVLPDQPPLLPFPINTVITDAYQAFGNNGIIGRQDGESAHLFIEKGGGLTLSQFGFLWMGVGELQSNLTISTGGSFRGFRLTAGFSRGTVGVFVTGQNSTISVTDILMGQETSTGSLTVEDSARVTASGVVELGSFFPTGAGTIQINGTPGSRGTLATRQIIQWTAGSSVRFDGGEFEAASNQTEIFSSNLGAHFVSLQAGGGTIDSAGFDIATSQNFSGSGALNKVGSGAFVLHGTHAYSGGTNVEGGTLDVRGGITHTTQNFRATLGGKLLVSNGGQARGNSAIVRDSGILEVRDTNSLLALQTDLQIGTSTDGEAIVSGGGRIVAPQVILGGPSGGSGVLTLQGNSTARGVLETASVSTNDGTGTVSFEGGIFRALQNQSEVFQASGTGTLQVLTTSSGAFIDSNNFAIGTSAAISGAGGLNKIGTGSLNVRESSTYSGGTTVSSGTLLVNNFYGSATGTGEVFVDSGGTLGGNGFIEGDTTIAGVLSPGNSIGTLSFAGAIPVSLILQGTSTVNMEIASLFDHDLIMSNGPIEFGGTLQVSLLNGYVPVVGNTFALFSSPNPGIGQFQNISFSDPGISGDFNSSNGVLTISAIPEPNTLSLLIGLFVASALCRRSLGKAARR